MSGGVRSYFRMGTLARIAIIAVYKPHYRQSYERSGTFN